MRGVLLLFAQFALVVGYVLCEVVDAHGGCAGYEVAGACARKGAGGLLKMWCCLVVVVTRCELGFRGSETQ